MISPNCEWKQFSNDTDKMTRFKHWGLLSPKTTYFKQLSYNGVYTDCVPTPCDVVGYIDDSCIILNIHGQLHKIHPVHFCDMQPSKIAPLEYVVFDLETTGFSPKNDKIIEIAAIKYKNNVPVDTFSTLINPLFHIPSSSSKVHHLTDSDVCTSPTIETVIPQFLDFIGNLPIVAHNAPFDVRFLNENLPQGNFKLNNVVFDTLALIKKEFPLLSSYKLSNLAQYFNIEVEESHRALPDVETTAILFKKYFDSLELDESYVAYDDKIPEIENDVFNKIYSLIDPKNLETSSFYVNENSKTTPYNSIMIRPHGSPFRGDNPPEQLFARINATSKTKYLSFSNVHLWLFEKYNIHTDNVPSEIGFFRVSFNIFSETFNQNDFISNIFNQIFLDSFSFESFGCCSKYVECSKVQHCVHSDLLYSLSCQYRTNLESGHIFY